MESSEAKSCCHHWFHFHENFCLEHRRAIGYYHRANSSHNHQTWTLLLRKTDVALRIQRKLCHSNKQGDLQDVVLRNDGQELATEQNCKRNQKWSSRLRVLIIIMIYTTARRRHKVRKKFSSKRKRRQVQFRTSSFESAWRRNTGDGSCKPDILTPKM